MYCLQVKILCEFVYGAHEVDDGGKLAHGSNPVLRWMMDNIFIRTDPAGNIKADKEKSTEKIDGAVPLL